MCQKICRVDVANSFIKFCHPQSNHSATALVARMSCDQSHVSAPQWSCNVTQQTVYALKECDQFVANKIVAVVVLDFVLFVCLFSFLDGHILPTLFAIGVNFVTPGSAPQVCLFVFRWQIVLTILFAVRDVAIPCTICLAYQSFNSNTYISKVTSEAQSSPIRKCCIARFKTAGSNLVYFGTFHCKQGEQTGFAGKMVQNLPF